MWRGEGYLFVCCVPRGSGLGAAASLLLLLLLCCFCAAAATAVGGGALSFLRRVVREAEGEIHETTRYFCRNTCVL